MFNKKQTLDLYFSKFPIRDTKQWEFFLPSGQTIAEGSVRAKVCELAEEADWHQKLMGGEGGRGTAEARSQPQIPFSGALHLGFGNKMAYFMKLVAHGFCLASGHCISLISTSSFQGLQTWANTSGFFCGFWRLNLGPSVCTTALLWLSYLPSHAGSHGSPNLCIQHSESWSRRAGRGGGRVLHSGALVVLLRVIVPKKTEILVIYRTASICLHTWETQFSLDEIINFSLFQFQFSCCMYKRSGHSYYSIGSVSRRTCQITKWF